MKKTNQLARSIAVSLGISLGGFAMQAHALGDSSILTVDGASMSDSAAAQSWNGSNNPTPYTGWAHNSDWYSLDVSNTGTVEIQVKGTVAGMMPAFTIWNTGDANANPPNAHLYNQIGNTSWLPGSFVGFANNSSDAHFGVGPSNTALGGPAAASGVSVQIGTDSSGYNYADLFFTNTTANTWYAIAVGGSGGGGTYTISASSAVPVPSAVWLFATGLCSLLGYKTRKRAAL
jgi:hypothetical protein